ncbi:hypothetical protein C8J56DRAFT_1168184 [Mycena floridula]|nr:hypothetical protein C8J56DRAFT_1168184 [Mycena floridula]
MIRITGAFKHRPDISFEEFEDIWTNHAKVFNSIKYVQNNIIRYTQKDVGAPLREIGLENVNQFDGIGHFDVESVDVYLNLLKDEDYLRVVVPDAQRFLDIGSVQISIGVEEVKFEKQ